MKMSVGELMTVLNEVTPTEHQGLVFGPLPQDASEVNTPRRIAPDATTSGDLPAEVLPELPEGMIFDVKPFLALVNTDEAKRRIFEVAMNRRITVAKPAAFKRVMKMFLDMDTSVKQYLLAESDNMLSQWLSNSCEADDRGSFDIVRRVKGILIPGAKKKPTSDVPKHPALPLLAEQESRDSGRASSSAGPPDNLMSDEKAKSLYDSYKKGGDGFLVGGRLGRLQLLNYFTTKFGRERTGGSHP